MRPINFKGMNCTYSEHQPEYRPLPAHRDADGCITSCWYMGLFERFIVLITGRVYISNLTFNKPLQPQLLQLTNPMEKE